MCKREEIDNVDSLLLCEEKAKGFRDGILLRIEVMALRVGNESAKIPDTEIVNAYIQSGMSAVYALLESDG